MVESEEVAVTEEYVSLRSIWGHENKSLDRVTEFVE